MCNIIRTAHLVFPIKNCSAISLSLNIGLNSSDLLEHELYEKFDIKDSRAQRISAFTVLSCTNNE